MAPYSLVQSINVVENTISSREFFKVAKWLGLPYWGADLLVDPNPPLKSANAVPSSKGSVG